MPVGADVDGRTGVGQLLHDSGQSQRGAGRHGQQFMGC